MVAIGAALAVWKLTSTQAPTVFQPIPLTSYSGRQDEPSFSPDGSQIAFDWDGPQGDYYDIYVKLIGPGSPLRLTTDPAPDYQPRWSPDGRSIAFVRGNFQRTGQYSVMVIPALGGPERRIGTFSYTPTNAGLNVPSLCWTRDSKALIVAASDSPGRPVGLELVPIDGGNETVNPA